MHIIHIAFRCENSGLISVIFIHKLKNKYYGVRFRECSISVKFNVDSLNYPSSFSPCKWWSRWYDVLCLSLLLRRYHGGNSLRDQSVPLPSGKTKGWNCTGRTANDPAVDILQVTRKKKCSPRKVCLLGFGRFFCRRERSNG